MMQKLIQSFPFKSILLPSLSQSYHSSLSSSLISWITAYSTFSLNEAFSPKPNVKNSDLADYLVRSFKFSKERSLSVVGKFSRRKSLEKPEEVIHFFRGLGFSDAHIRAIVHCVPRILFADIEKTLKPKVMFFHELGLSGPRLGSFISRTPYILYCSVNGSLKPSIHLIRKVLAGDGRNKCIEMVNDDVFRTITRCGRLILAKHTMKANVLYLESCGVVGSQLSSLLFRLPRIFLMQQDKLAEVVSRALDMNFTKGSRMLVHGIHSLSCMTMRTLNGKFEVFRAFGFTKEETDLMFRKSPYVFALSVAKLRCKLELLLNNLKINRLAVVQIPGILSLNIEERVIPRYKVLEILKLRGLIKKDSSLCTAMCLQESKFLQRYILPFKTDAEELLLAYRGQFLSTSQK
ncbi:hypothetical protein C2S53_015323 [Perilla frutescens var. hirtella]|uniref:Uncharacterized protein n=1 Tax=Perilla frutescens var. hirtella TaxID=608512 RepID=A0AAD4JBB0_PERFH|nr:hypothetical protein C2S53_015323 [Perilla frutescens var. hirtella]